MESEAGVARRRIMRTGLILAGGRSVRMGSSKQFVLLREKPLLLYVLNALEGVVDELLVSLARGANREQYLDIIGSRAELVDDLFTVQNPLVGIYSGLKRASHAYSAVVGCDSPFVSPKVMEFLFTEAVGHDGAVPVWPDGRLEPLHAVYRTAKARDASLQALHSNEPSNQGMVARLQSVKWVPVDLLRRLDPQLRSLFNINTPQDLVAAEADPSWQQG